MPVKFTDRYLQSLKGTGELQTIREGRGFAIVVLPSGYRKFVYIYTLRGMRRQMSLGSYPATTLAEARQKYNEAYTKVQRKEDPQADKEGEPSSFKEHAAEYCKAYARTNTPRSTYIVERALLNDVLPFWGTKDITEIRKRDAITLLERVAARSPGQVQNVCKAARGVFEYAIDREYLEHSPMQRLTRAIPELKERARERVLDATEIQTVWNDTSDSNIARALKLILCTAQRPGEVAGMHRREIQGNVWTIPKERSKMKIQHTVYLTDLAISLIGTSEGYIFAGGKPGTALLCNSISDAVASGRGAKLPYYNLPRWTPHDLRRTARTNMARIGIPEEHAEAILGHQKQGVVKVYNQYAYQAEKAQAMRLWEAELLSIVTTA